MADNKINVTVSANTRKSITVASAQQSTEITASTDTGRFWAQTSKNWAVSENIVDNTDYSSKYYATQAKESATSAGGFESSTREIYDSFSETANNAIADVQGARDEAIANIETSRVDAIDSMNSTKTTILNDIEFVADGEKKEINELADVIKDNADSIINRVGLNMFDTVVKDHILTYEESKGLALQGTYAYKTAIAGERWGYPDFYAKVVQKYNEATATETVNGVTVKVHSNGHKFYNIADKTGIDEFFNTMGSAWFYGVDIENECIFLPRNNYFDQATGDVSEVGLSVEAGLPNIEGQLNSEAGFITTKGAFTKTSTAVGASLTNGTTTSVVDFNASNSNPIYGNSDTVQPNAVKKLLYICVGNTVSDTSWVDIVTQVKGGVKDLEDKKNASIAEIDANAKSYDNLTKRQITNCLLEVPQNIKLELNNSTLTLKAGSKVIVPNGVGLFDEVVVSADKTITNTSNDTYMVFVRKDTNGLALTRLATQTASGTSTPTSGWYGYYNTNDNKVYRIEEGINKTLMSLPIGIITVSNGAIASIDQIFNSMGYIGSTIWVDKGVKGLIPNGRNEDGSLKNIETANNKVLTYTNSVLRQNASLCLGNLFISPQNILLYDAERNINLSGGTDPIQLVNIATWSADSTGVISNFQPKQPFRAVDYSDYRTEMDAKISSPITALCTTKATTASSASSTKPAVVIENYLAGTSWYRVWSDGWIEQGGLVSISQFTTSATQTVTLLRNFANTNYSCFVQLMSGGTNWAWVQGCNVLNKAVNKFDIGLYGSSAGTINAHKRQWYACGY